MRRSLFVAVVAVLGVSVQTGAQASYAFVVVAGSDITGSRDGVGAEAQFSTPAGVARDTAGNLFVADTGNLTVRKVTPAGAVTTLAGAAGQSGTADGTGAAARFIGPRGLAIDAAGNVYVTDSAYVSGVSTYAVRKITPAGVVTTVGTSQIPSFMIDWLGIGIDDRDGTIFVANRGYHIIERFTQAGVVSVFAGESGVSGTADGTGAAARFNRPTGIAVDASGLIYVSDTGNHTIRRATPEGVVSTWLGVAGDRGTDTGVVPQEEYRGVDGPPAVARFNSPEALTLDRATGRLLSVGYTFLRFHAAFQPLVTRDRLRAITADGTVSTLFAGEPQIHSGIWAGDVALISASTAPTSGGGGNLHTLFSVTLTGDLTAFAGRGTGCTRLYSVNGSRLSGRFCQVGSIDVDAAGVLYVADVGNFTLRRVAADGAITTLARGTRQPGSTDGDGANARFGGSTTYTSGMGLALGGNGQVYVADTANSTVRRVESNGVTSTVAGSPGVQGAIDAASGDARFNLPHDVAVDSQGSVFVADTGNSSIRKITFGTIGVFQTNFVSTVAGVSGTGGSADGTGADARFANPYAIAMGPDDVAYIADTGNHTIRRMTSAGVVTTVAGLAGTAGTVDGTGAAVRVNAPRTIAVDQSGNVFFGEAGGIRMLTPSGTVSTLTTPFSCGSGCTDSYQSVTSVDAAGTLYGAHGATVIAGTTAGATAAAPAITTPPSNLTVGAGSTTPGMMFVAASGVPAPTFRWEVSTDGGSTWTALSDGGGITGSASSTLTFTGVTLASNGTQYRAIATNALGSATSASAVLTVVGASASPSSLRFGIERGGGHYATAQQRVVAIYTGSDTPSWTASVNASWLSVDGSTTNGAQTGAFAIDLVPSAIDFATAPDTMAATLTIAASNVGVTVQVPVTLRLLPAGPRPVIGQVDTPIQNATGVQGAIGVTGWAVHSLGISGVRVYRDCLVGQEPCTPGQEPGLGTRRVVFIGFAVFVPGARPDIEAAFPEYPASHIGGWGMQILTNQLPRTTGTFAANGGQGPITLHVLATPLPVAFGYNSDDARLLSRAWTDTTYNATTITLDNDAIAKPFGTIDTPASGATVSGTVANFGWALTPDSDTVADGSDILIPTNGSTMVVFIDGVATAQVAYNQCRDGVGNPVPAGAFCGDDISNIFGNTTPQEALGTRTSNPTRFRNLDAARGAIGAYNIDTTTLSNGLHTIAWSVTDSAGRVEGIGSRYFTVLNGSSDAVSAEFGVLNAQRAESRRSLAPRHGSGQPEPLSKVGEGGDFQIVGRTGFDLRRPWTPLHADVNGVRHVRIPIDNGRVELSLGAGIEAAYLDANGERRPLPPGSAFDANTGIFTWAPGAGYLGTYRFVFSGPGVLESWGPGVLGAPSADFSAITVDVTLRAETKAAAGESEVRMHLDAARLRQPSTTAQVAPSSVEGQGSGAATTLIDVVGWALDPQAEIGSGIGAVHIWARRLGPGVLGSWGPEVQGGASPVFLGAAELDVARPDVAAAFGAPFGHAGFRLESATALPPGEYEITAYVWNWRTARWEDARSARVTVR